MAPKLVVTTCPDGEADALARRLLERRLIACANLLRSARSHYHWEGRIETADETVILMKTADDRVEGLVAAIQELHSYSVPEVIVLPIEGGNSAYLAWVSAETRRPE
jgi:periplasmic divalent cation tolerance protein